MARQVTKREFTEEDLARIDDAVGRLVGGAAIEPVRLPDGGTLVFLEGGTPPQPRGEVRELLKKD